MCLYLHIVGHLFFVSVWSFWEERTCRFLAHLSFFCSKRCPVSVCMSQTVHIFDFFITTKYHVSKLISQLIVPLGVLKCLNIQENCTWLWLAETFSTSPELLHVKSPNLSEMFLYVSSRSVVTIQSNSNSNMAATVSYLSRHFLLFFQNDFMSTLAS